MGISDQFKDKAEQMRQQGGQHAQGMKDEARQRMQQRKGKQQGQPERGRPMDRDQDEMARDRQGMTEDEYEV
ncbi:hypothetical protein LUX12_03885 [Streptomyces somaliensis]|uniref:hypothetical protein n=1 Tax=Streptomyces somaliensis TaxID=78355 RepID=UPI0020CEBD7C|nr:hypothetical protein [Streptomyces somaliensis]MCP9944123.1 hypothetical protein [Streptomyces somaliensis]MCP9962643.1 hypothetical protein [Streptomyces somaliensis]MCP9975473.1 hypothetical protein [Streptomyces somaliensis]